MSGRDEERGDAAEVVGTDGQTEGGGGGVCAACQQQTRLSFTLCAFLKKEIYRKRFKTRKSKTRRATSSLVFLPGPFCHNKNDWWRLSHEVSTDDEQQHWNWLQCCIRYLFFLQTRLLEQKTAEVKLLHFKNKLTPYCTFFFFFPLALVPNHSLNIIFIFFSLTSRGASQFVIIISSLKRLFIPPVEFKLWNSEINYTSIFILSIYQCDGFTKSNIRISRMLSNFFLSPNFPLKSYLKVLFAL